MACSTGKTFTALRVAEQFVEDGLLFVASTTALVSQARREWLRQTARELSFCRQSGRRTLPRRWCNALRD